MSINSFPPCPPNLPSVGDQLMKKILAKRLTPWTLISRTPGRSRSRIFKKRRADERCLGGQMSWLWGELWKHYCWVWTLIKMVLECQWAVKARMKLYYSNVKKISGPTAQSMVTSGKLWKSCFWVWTLVKALKNGAELNMNESLESEASVGMRTSMKFVVIPRKFRKLRIIIAFEMPWKSYFWTCTLITGLKNGGARTSTRCHI